jgi:branched-chain amino acid transport system substrate-binding protein
MNKATQIIIGVLIVLIVVVGASLLVWPPEKAGPNGNVIKSTRTTEKPTIKIGVSLPLTGEGASFGIGGMAGINLAVKEINDRGGINGRKIVIVAEDDLCNPNGGTNAMNKLVNLDQVDVVIGPVCSAAGGASLPIAQASKTPVIFWASAPHLPALGDYLFRTYPSDSFQGKYGAEYLFNTMGKRKAAVLYSQNDWGKGLHDVFTRRFIELGGEIVFDDGVAPETKDLRSTISKLLDSEPDVVYMPLYPVSAVAAVRQMKEFGSELLMFGGDALETDEFIKSGVGDGVLYTAGKINNPDEFKAKVKQVTGKDSNIITPLGYDAVYIFADVMSRVGTDKANIKDALQALSYRNGISLPLIEFDEEGDLASAEIEVKIVMNKESKVYRN